MRCLLYPVLIILIVFFSCNNEKTTAPVVSEGAELNTSMIKITGLNGQPVNMDLYKGKTLFINFWATWCKPCTTEMPAMQATYDKLREKGFVVLAINELEDDAKVREHIKQHGHTFPVLMDRDNRVANQFGVFGLPVSVFIDEKGVVQEYIKGGLLTEDKIYQAVQRIQGNKPMQAASVK